MLVFFLWVFAQDILMSTKINKHVELYVPTVKRGWIRFTACNQMQMGPQSLCETVSWKVLMYFSVPSTLREVILTAIAWVTPSVVGGWCVQLAWPCRYRGSGEVLSFKPGAAVQHSRFLLTETLPCTLLSVSLTMLSQAQCVCEEVSRALCLSCECVQHECDECVWSAESGLSGSLFNVMLM